MTREEFLARFPLRTPVPFKGRGPFMAKDAERGIYVLVHLLERWDPAVEPLLSGLAERIASGSDARIFELTDAIAVVTPNESAFSSLEAWLATGSETAPIRIKFRPPPSKSQPAPPPSPPPAPPPESADGPGEFTQIFGSSPLQKPAPRPVPPTKEPQVSPPPPAPEESVQFTQIFGKSEEPQRSPLDRMERSPLKPTFDSTPIPPPSEPDPVQPEPPPPVPSDDQGQFTRFFGNRAEEKAPTDLPAPRFGSASSAFSPEPARPSPEPQPVDHSSDAADPGAFTQIVSGRKARAPKQPVEPPAPPEPAPDAEPDEAAPPTKRSIVPLVLVLGIALVATLVLILVLVLLK